MAQKSIQGSRELAGKIKKRRNELELTIEAAALRAGVGTKTWCRYEAGESIRKDKCKGICKALNWNGIPDLEMEEDEKFSAQKYKNHEAWSKFLEEHFGVQAAMSFAAGSDILLDYIQDDMEKLASMPAGTHIGQLDVSWLRDSLPEQFLMQYNYEFLYQMKCTLNQMRMCTKRGFPMVAHSVMEELILYLCCDEASALIKLNGDDDASENEDAADYKDWIFDLFDDMDLVSFLYAGVCLDATHSFHFSHWTERQFYAD